MLYAKQVFSAIGRSQLKKADISTGRFSWGGLKLRASFSGMYQILFLDHTMEFNV